MLESASGVSVTTTDALAPGSATRTPARERNGSIRARMVFMTS
ncbi:hypothetical protein CDEF62S_02828 [Castellaniella defragrans]